MTTEHTRALEAKLAAAEALLAERRAELAARKAAKPEAMPVPRGWSSPEDPPFDLAAPLDADEVRAMFQALSRRAQELGIPVVDVPAIRMAPEDCNGLPVACGPDDDDDDPRPAKTREELEAEREALLEELEREAQEQ